MRKVINFVKGKREDRKDGGGPANASPFTEEASGQCVQAAGFREEDANTSSVEQAWGYNVDFTGKDKTVTKLHKAAWQGNVEKLKVNLKKTDMDVTDRANRTALHLAAAQGHTNVVWFLLGNKAKINICDNEGKTPFLKAIECGHKDCVHLMLERGVDLNTIDYSGNSGLHTAARQGFYEIASLLLKQGANFESSNNLGESPLHVATQAEHADVVELLLRYGSSVNVVDRDNRSPLMFAAKCGNMALVQLFLEYGAQRRVQDSNDWTAEDYAILGGHHDVAAELKSPSEATHLPFHEQQLEPVERDRDSFRLPMKRSVSATSLPPPPPEDKEEDGDKKTDDADSSDTWNDSQLSEACAKPQSSGLKLTKFLPPSSEDENSEESSKMADIKEEEMQDSPRSCVIPPPCKPPRSWDLIQSGVIDDPKGSEPRRRSLLTLGSLRSKRESFADSPSGADSPSFQTDSPNVGIMNPVTKGEGELQETPGSPSAEPRTDKEEKKKSNVVSRDSLKGSESDSEWDSDDSLPLDNLPGEDAIPPPIPPLPLEVLSPHGVRLPDGDDATSGTTNSEKRGRFLLRASSIDLTDDDGEASRDKSLTTSSKDTEKRDGGDNPSPKTEMVQSMVGTLGREGTMMGYEEMWEANAHLSVADSVPHSSASDTHLSIHEEPDEVEPQAGLELKEPWRSDLLFPSPRLDQRPKQTSLGSYEQAEAKSGRYKLESRSLDGLDDKAQQGTAVPATGDTRLLRTRKHSRQQSVSVLSWSRSEETHEVASAVAPSSLERMMADSRRINKQLECYDEALRELAQVSLVRKQSSLPLPARKDMGDLAPTRYAGARNQRYLSLPRTNELIDEAFKEIGQSSVTMKQGSLSLPRTATPQDMASEAEPVPPPRSKKSSFRSRRRAESEGEALGPRLHLRDHVNRSRSCDTKLQASGRAPSSEPATTPLAGRDATAGTPTTTDSPSGSSETPRSDTSGVSLKDPGADKPLRKKRKILLAMRCFRGHHRESVSDLSPTEVSLQESVEEPPFWMSTDRGAGLERQSTVIERSVYSPKDITSPVSPLSPVSVETLVDIQEAGTGAADRDDLLAAGNFPEKGREIEEEQAPEVEEEAEAEAAVEAAKRVEHSSVQIIIEEVLAQEEMEGEEEREAEDLPPLELQEAGEVERVGGGGEEERREEKEFPSPPHELIASLLLAEAGRDADPPGDRAPSTQPSIAEHRDSVSDADSGASQNDATPPHLYGVQGHHTLLKEHLRAATAERGRLEEAAAQLGERAEKLKYELADAEETARGREQVISLLRTQLARMEELYTRCLEDGQRCRLRLAHLEQELQHVHGVCRKYEEDKAQLSQVIQQKEEERANLDLLATSKEEERRQRESVCERDRQRVEHELRRLQQERESMEREVQALCREKDTLQEEKAAQGLRTALEMDALQQECQRWKELYEEGVRKLTEATARPGGQAEEGLAPLQDVRGYKDELRDVIECLEGLKDKECCLCQEKVKEEVSHLVAIMRGEYSKVEAALSVHNARLAELAQQPGSCPGTGRRSVWSQCDVAADAMPGAAHLSEENRQLREEVRRLREGGGVGVGLASVDILADENKSLRDVIADKNRLYEELICKVNDLTADREQLQALVRAPGPAAAPPAHDKATQTDGDGDWSLLLKENELLRGEVEGVRQELGLLEGELHTLLGVKARTCAAATPACAAPSKAEDVVGKLSHVLHELRKENTQLTARLEAAAGAAAVEQVQVEEEEEEEEEEEGAAAVKCAAGEDVQQQKKKAASASPWSVAKTCSRTAVVEVEPIQPPPPPQQAVPKTTPPLSVPLPLLIEPADIEQEFSCKNVAVHPKVYVPRNGRRGGVGGASGDATRRAAAAAVAAATAATGGAASTDCEGDHCKADFGGGGGCEKTGRKGGRTISDPQARTSVPGGCSNVTRLQEQRREHERRKSERRNTTEAAVDLRPDKEVEVACYSLLLADLAGVDKGRAARASRDAATNTTPSPPPAPPPGLQQELQQERERGRRNQQSIRRLKAELQVLRGKLALPRPNGGAGSGGAVPPPVLYEQTLSDFQRKVVELEQKVREENSLRFALEVQVNKMRYELQEKSHLERELGLLRGRLDRDFVSRAELEQLKRSYEAALHRARHLGAFVHGQEQARHDAHDTRLKLLGELAKVQATLQEKGEKERELRQKCERLARECERKQELRRKRLIDKSLGASGAGTATVTKDKELPPKGLLEVRSPPHHSCLAPVRSPVHGSMADVWPVDNPFSHILRRELERSIRKHARSDSLPEPPTCSQSPSDDHMDLLKKKYFLH